MSDIDICNHNVAVTNIFFMSSKGKSHHSGYNLWNLNDNCCS